MKGWLGLATFVAVYDAWAGATKNRTLSRAFRETAKVHPYICWGLCIYMTAHLHGLIPQRIDPLSAYTAAFAKVFDA